ncbi:nitroreductase family protein [Candidatus Woesearchaeota archaeon]|nr:nitroreductase family protein [Candidatus Woesearchaeota archaeon]
MNLDQIFDSRHSIRDYQDKDVSYDLIGELIDSARKAPSCGNVQNWRFIIVKDKKKRNEIAAASLKQYWMNQSPVHIVVCYDDSNIKELYPKLHEEFSLLNSAITASYITLKAIELKLGTCLVAVFDKNAVSKTLKLPSNIHPIILITVGYPKGRHKVTKRHPIEYLIYFDEYGFARKKRDASIFPLQKQVQKLTDKIKKGLKK